MEVHKPTPWHGWREFLKEYLIIVIGVLTALAGEQGVEWLHWRHEVRGAREALKADYLRLIRWSGERQAESPCIKRRLGEIAAHLEAAETSGRLSALGRISSPSERPWTVRAWDGVVSSQVLSHFPQNEAMLATANALYTKPFQETRDAELQHWAVLRTLTGPSRRLEVSEVTNMRAAVGMAAREADFMQANAGGLASQTLATGFVSRAEAVKAWSVGVASGQKSGICQPLGPVPLGLADAVNDPSADGASGKATQAPF